MIEQQSPLVDASMEIKTNAALHHLWLEELIQDATSIDEKKIWEYLDASEWYAKAMLHGAENEEGKFIPLDDDVLNNQIQSLIERIHDLRKIGKIRVNSPSLGKIGSQLDQDFDASFELLIQQADGIESYIQAIIFNQTESYKTISFALLISFVIISIDGWKLEYADCR